MNELSPSVSGSVSGEVFQNCASMTSREIAELVGSRHDKVKQSIERLAGRGVIELPPMMKTSTATKSVAVYIFTGNQGKRDSYVVVAKMAPQHIGAIVDAWGRTADTLAELLAALEAFDVPDDLPEGMFVYAILEKDSGHIKLGISRDPRQRLAQLQTGNSSELELVACRPASNRFADERAIHADAEAYKLRGEWFTGAALGLMQ